MKFVLKILYYRSKIANKKINLHTKIKEAYLRQTIHYVKHVYMAIYQYLIRAKGTRTENKFGHVLKFSS